MDKQIVRRKILTILSSITKKAIKEKEDVYNQSLTGRDFLLSPMDMVYFYLEVCSAFPEVTFQPEDFKQYAFNSIDGITSIIIKQTDGSNCLA